MNLKVTHDRSNKWKYNPLKCQLIKTKWVILGDNQFVSRHILHTKSFNMPVSYGLTTVAHLLNGYEVCLNTTNCLIVNMSKFRYWMCTSILDYFGSCSIPNVNDVRLCCCLLSV